MQIRDAEWFTNVPEHCAHEIGVIIEDPFSVGHHITTCVARDKTPLSRTSFWSMCTAGVRFRGNVADAVDCEGRTRDAAWFANLAKHRS